MLNECGVEQVRGESCKMYDNLSAVGHDLIVYYTLGNDNKNNQDEKWEIAFDPHKHVGIISFRH